MGQQNIHFMDQTDLTTEQIELTRKSYETHAKNYSVSFERNPTLNGHITQLLLSPFLSHYSTNQLSDPILFAGCGSCRDLQYLENQNYPVVGIDTSGNLLDLARQNGVKSNLIQHSFVDYPLASSSFGGIFCESALCHLDRESERQAIANFTQALVPKGIVFLGFREGDGRVYMTEEKFGTRYYLSTTLSDAIDLVNNHGLDIIGTSINPHPIKGRPNFITILAQKK